MPNYKLTLAHMRCPQKRELNSPLFRSTRTFRNGKIVEMVCEKCGDEVWLSSEEVKEPTPTPEEAIVATPQIVIP